MKNKNILITGAQGFIGSNLLVELLPKYNIIGTSLTSGKKFKNYNPLRKNILKLESRDISQKTHGIIHLAAITDVEFCNKHPEKCFTTNAIGTQKTLEIARKKDCKFIYMSTGHVYGKPEKIPIREDHPRNPLSIYAASKLAGEIICEAYAKTYGMNISIVRLFSVFGPNSPPHLVTSRIVSQLDKKSIILGNVSAKRDFIFISDATKAIKVVLEKSNGFNSYNVGSGKAHSVFELCNMLKRAYGLNTPIKSEKTLLRKSDVPKIVANISKIKKLGWRPKVPVQKGLQKYYEWYKTQKSFN